jgi:hypothetical protein
MAAASTVQRVDARAYGARDETSTKMPTVYDFSIGVQRELPWNIVVETSYVGNRQSHQPVSFDLNAVPVGTAWQSQYVDPRSAGYNFAGAISASNPGPPLPGSNAVDSVAMRPFRGLAALTMQPNVGTNRYDSWQTSVNKRFGHGLTRRWAHKWAQRY